MAARTGVGDFLSCQNRTLGAHRKHEKVGRLFTARAALDEEGGGGAGAGVVEHVDGREHVRPSTAVGRVVKATGAHCGTRTEEGRQ